MLLKSKDGRLEDIQELNRLLTLNVTAKQRFSIEREIKCLVSGERNEQNSAYYLDFKYKDSPHWALIHDLRIEHRGRVAQIDHLLINRFLDVYVLESKNYYYGVKITEEGEFLVWDGKGYQAIESPYEQNQRHIQALQTSVEDRNLGPRRLGFSIPISYRNVVLISPTSKLLKPSSSTFDLFTVIKADAFVSATGKDIDNKSIISAPKIVGCDTLQEFSEKLVRLHRPGSINFAAKFGISNNDTIDGVQVASIVASPASPVYSPAVHESKDVLACRNCNSPIIAVMYGKFGYYFKCGECDGNTPIKIACGTFGHNERIRKDGKKFFRECGDCRSSSLFFVNP
jgi:hypothetical protein